MDDVDDWSSVAIDWARYWAPVAEPAQRALLAAAGLAAGWRVLDVGCGSGELLALLDDAGAVTAGCDPSAAMVALARARSPRSDVRVARGEDLPWPDDAFDLVTLVNALAFTDVEETVRECARVGLRVAVASWAGDDHNDLTVLERALAGDDHEPSDETREPGYLGDLLASHCLTVQAERLTATPMVLPDATSLVHALTAGADPQDRPEVAPVLLTAAAPFRQDDGRYVLRNAFRWAVASR
jgi:SAM-dependent methyltransferase